MAVKELTFLVFVCSWIVSTTGDEIFTSTGIIFELNIHYFICLLIFLTLFYCFVRFTKKNSL